MSVQNNQSPVAQLNDIQPLSSPLLVDQFHVRAK